MTKVEAIQKVLENNNGTASLEVIYEEIGNYYPNVKKSNEWQAGIRGVLYREIKNSQKIKKIGLSIYALKDYNEEPKPNQTDQFRMHSYIEGLCLELGNFKNFATYTADPSALYPDNLKLNSLATMRSIPDFSYPEIVQNAKKMDVIWFNSKGLIFPQKVFEIVDSISTLSHAFNRCLQLKNFRASFFIVAPEKYESKFNKTINLEAYQDDRDRFKFINYEQIIDLYENAMRVNKIESIIF